MSFLHPWVLLLLGIPALLAGWEWLRRGHAIVLPFDHANAARGRGLDRVVGGLNLAAPALLAVAILIVAGPQRMAQPELERSMSNIQFCLDVSGSMTSRFGDGTRADKAIQAIIDFTSYRKGDAFGLSLFGNEVIHWVPLTRDLSAIRLSAPFLKPERMPPYLGGTQIAKALREVRKVMIRRPEGDRMVILISDGLSPDLRGGAAGTIGRELAQDGIVVFYIHVAEGAPQSEAVTVSSLTGGAAFAAGDPLALKEVFQRIDQMRPAQLKPSTPAPVDFFRPFAAAGLGLLGLQLLAALGLRYTPW